MQWTYYSDMLLFFKAEYEWSSFLVCTLSLFILFNHVFGYKRALMHQLATQRCNKPLISRHKRSENVKRTTSQLHLFQNHKKTSLMQNITQKKRCQPRFYSTSKLPSQENRLENDQNDFNYTSMLFLMYFISDMVVDSPIMFK